MKKINLLVSMLLVTTQPLMYPIQGVMTSSSPDEISDGLDDVTASNDKPRDEQQSDGVVNQNWGELQWVFDEVTGTLCIEGNGKLGTFESSPWNREDELRISFNNIKKIVLDGDIEAPTDSSYLFSSSLDESMSGLIDIEGLENLNTQNVQNFSHMFYGLSSIKTLDLKGFNTEKATDMSYMFSKMVSLENLDISTFDMSNVENVANMFTDTQQLKYLTLGSEFRFKSTEASLCEKIKTNEYSGYWKNTLTGKVIGNSNDFMESYDGTEPGTYTWDTVDENWGDIQWSFDENAGILQFTGEGVLGVSSESPWNRQDKRKINSSKVKKIIFKDKVKAPENAANLFSSRDELNYLTSLETIEGLALLDTSETTDFSGIFKGLKSLTSLDLSNFDTTKAKNTSYLDRFFNIGESPVMQDAFRNLDNLNTLILGEKFNFISVNASLPNSQDEWVNETTKERIGNSEELMKKYDGSNPGKYIKQAREELKWGDVSYTFDEDTGVLTFTSGGTFNYHTNSPWNRTDGKGIDILSIKKIIFTEKVMAPGDSSRLFSGIEDADHLDNLESFEGLDKLDTSNATNLRYMFYGMQNIPKLDLSSFETHNVIDMTYMFYGMHSLTEINVSSFDTSKVNNMWSMFYGMKNVKELDLSNFDTPKVKNTGTMFEGMEKLEKLDLSNFDMRSVTYNGAMFAKTERLKELKLGDNFSFHGRDADLPGINAISPYSGSWRYVEKDRIIEDSNAFMDMASIEAGTYIWDTNDRKPLFMIEQVPERYDFKINSETYNVDQYYRPINTVDNIVSVSDRRMIKTKWELTVSASPFIDKRDDSNQLDDLKFKMNLKQTPSTIDSLAVAVPQTVLLDSDPETIIKAPGVETQDPRDVFVSVDIDSIELMVPEFTQDKVNKTYTGNLNWMVNFTP